MTLYDKLIEAGLPIASATETGAVSGLPGVVFTYEQQQTMQDIVLEYLNPTAYADLLAMRADKQAMKDAYLVMIARLEQIQNAGAIPFTQAGFNQLVSAVKDLALYEERIMKTLVRLIA